MSAVRALIAIGVSVMVAGAAAAADRLPKAPSLDDLDARGGFAQERGLYLRADLGTSWQGVTQAKSGLSNLSGFQYEGLDIEASRLLSVGIGYRVQDWLRVDVTSEWRGGADLVTQPVYACGGGTCRDRLTGALHSQVTLLNAYFEVGSWFEMTPYLGVSAGVAHHRLGEISISGADTGNVPAHSQNKLALALTAGAAYDINERVKIDLGYRYSHLGKIESAAFDCGGTGICNGGRQALRLSSHDLRLGLRFVLEDTQRLMEFGR